MRAHLTGSRSASSDQWSENIGWTELAVDTAAAFSWKRLRASSHSSPQKRNWRLVWPSWSYTLFSYSISINLSFGRAPTPIKLCYWIKAIGAVIVCMLNSEKWTIIAQTLVHCASLQSNDAGIRQRSVYQCRLIRRLSCIKSVYKELMWVYLSLGAAYV